MPALAERPHQPAPSRLTATRVGADMDSHARILPRRDGGSLMAVKLSPRAAHGGALPAGFVLAGPFLNPALVLVHGQHSPFFACR
jgi:hypothetical protein